mgnify:CR=1 FL=1
MEEASDTAAPSRPDDQPPVDLDQLLAEAEAISQEIVDGRSLDEETTEEDLRPADVTQSEADSSPAEDSASDQADDSPPESDSSASKAAHDHDTEIGETAANLLEHNDHPGIEKAPPTSEDIDSDEMADVLGDVDPLEAVERVEADAEELNDLLNDPDAPRIEELGNVAAESASEESDSKAVEQADLEVDVRQEAAVFSSSAKFEDPVETESDASALETAEAKRLAGEEEEPAPAAEAAIRPPRRPFKVVLKAAARSTIGVIKLCVIGIVHAGFRTIEILDYPFRNLSPFAKQIIGLAGFVTLAMGVAAWFLPGLLTSNPFESMESGIATQ